MGLDHVDVLSGFIAQMEKVIERITKHTAYTEGESNPCRLLGRQA